MKQWIVVVLFLLSQSVMAENISKVINLTYKNAQDIIPLVQPLLKPGDKISGSGQTLIVNVSPQTLTQLRSVLHAIDVPPVTFDIAVFQGPSNWLSTQDSGAIVYSTQSQNTMQRSQSVKVMNGEMAYVSTGEQVPIVTSVGVGFWTGVNYQQHNITKGFYIEPQLQGQMVKLKIRQTRQQMDQVMGQNFDEQYTTTTVMVPLNKWSTLSTAEGGGADQINNPASVSYSAGNSYSQNSTLYVKVNVVK